MSRYLDLANTLGSRIERGLYGAGVRLPSVRTLSLEYGVSLTTVQQAYRWLEMAGLVEARPRSGWYVPAARPAPELPKMGKPDLRPTDVSEWGQVQELLDLESESGTIQLGRGMPDVESPTLRPLQAALAREGRRAGVASLHYNDMQGVAALREQLSRLAIEAGYQRQRDIMTEWVRRYFPEGTRIGHPQGGFTLWIELPEPFDTHALDSMLKENGIAIAHGNIFSATGKYRNCMRLSHASVFTPRTEWAVRQIGEAAGEMLHSTC